MYGLPIRGVPEEAGKWWAFRFRQAPAPVLGALLGLLAAGVLLRRRE